MSELDPKVESSAGFERHTGSGLEPPHGEQRSINRIPVRLAASLKGRGAALGVTRDLSLQGAFIESREPLPAGVAFPVVIELEPKNPLQVHAEVVRVTPEGMGVRFHELSRDASRRLRRWVVEQTSVMGTRRQVELLHTTSSVVAPIRDQSRIDGFLDDIRESGAAVTLVSAARNARENPRLLNHGPDGVTFQCASPSACEVGESVFALLTIAFVSYAFEVEVLAVQGRTLRCSRPSTIVFSERRSRDRLPVPPGSQIRWSLPWDPDQKVALPLLDRSPSGLSFRAPLEGCLLAPGAPVIGELVIEGRVEPLVGAEVRHITRIEDPEGPWLRVGVAVGLGRTRSAESVPQRRVRAKTPIQRMFDKVRDTFSVILHRGRARLSGTQEVSRRVVVRGGELPIVGLLDRTSTDDARLSAPLVIVVPAFAGRKEQMAYLAGTLLEGFQRQSSDVAVLRLDGTNNLGESGKDPGCDKPGMHTLHFTLGGVMDDVKAALAWAKNNPYVDPTHLVVVSVSIGSVAVRHILARPDAADVTLWVSYVGAPEAIDSIRNFSGHLDLDAPFKEGRPLGVVSFGGSLVDGDRFFKDLHQRGIAYLDVAAEEMARIKADVIWVRGRQDAYIDPVRVERLMSVPAPGRREIADVEGGHIPRTSDEAIQQFVRITERVWEATRGSLMPSFWPSMGRLVARAEAEWEAVRRTDFVDRSEWWRRYLLDTEGPGFDILEYAPEYNEIMELQAQRVMEDDPKVIYELGAGTGNLTRRLLERGARVKACDFVPAALELLRQKCAPHKERLETALYDLEGSPFLAFRRFAAGDITNPLLLAERVPGLHKPVLEQLLAHQGDELTAALRGYDLDVARLARAWGLAPKAAALLADIALISRVAGSRETLDPTRREALLADARERLSFLPPSALDGPYGLDAPSDSADVVVLSLVLSYLARPEDALFEARRVLAPGGRLLVSSLVRDTESSKLYLGIVSRLEATPASAFAGPAPELMRQRLIEGARRFADHGGELMRLEEEGLFRFFDGQELAQRVACRGFVNIGVEPSFGTPPQAVVVTCQKA